MILLLALTVAAHQAVLEPPHGEVLAVPPSIVLTANQGIEVIAVTVSPTGVPFSCSARILGHDVVLDKGNCARVLKYKATPATDEKGYPVYGKAEIRLTWLIIRRDAKESPVPLSANQTDVYLPLSRLPAGLSENATSGLVLVAGPDGKVESCEAQKSSGMAALDAAACKAVGAAGIAPLKDETGTAVQGVQTVIVGFAVKP